MASNMEGWRLYRGASGADPSTASLPPGPPWRRFSRRTADRPALEYRIGEQESDIVNAALHLRRPLLVTGRPGTGKSSLAASIAHELGLGSLLTWPVNSRTALVDGLYRYDAIGRLR
ncbi:AAA family ATPase, partial [Streptomyces huasconensis]|uniref:AAA family ATPase n=1 Tax=Streptomyces huasconensis TaxID=1854574 RepID=UPI003405C14C